MKHAIIMACIISLGLISCKKTETVQPTKTVEHDTVKTVITHTVTSTFTTTTTYTVIEHDTVYISTNPPSILGAWNLYHWTQKQGATITDDNYPTNWNFLFEATDIVESIGQIYTYATTYTPGIVTIQDNGSSTEDYTLIYDFNKQEYVMQTSYLIGSTLIIKTFYLRK